MAWDGILFYIDSALEVSFVPGLASFYNTGGVRINALGQGRQGGAALPCKLTR